MELTIDDIANCKTKTARGKIVKPWFHSLPMGYLNPRDVEIVKYLFLEHYIPDYGEDKYDVNDINSVCVNKHSEYNTKCLYADFNGIEETLSINRLIGNPPNIITNSLRNAVHHQIKEFKNKNPKNPNAICPVTKGLLGDDAQVDHNKEFCTFKDIVNKFPHEEKNIKKYTYYDKNNKNYYLKEPLLSEWIEFHKKHAVLRWLSKKGNQIEK